MTGIARQYALAVFSLAKEQEKTDEFNIILNNFVKGIDDEASKFFSHPKISKKNKKAVLDEIVKNPLLLHFTKVLVDNDRFLLIQAIALAYKDILDELHKVMNVTVHSKKKLTKSNLEKIAKKLEMTYKRKVNIKEEIDSSILGGFRIEFDGNVLDETINRQLDNFKSSLSE